MMTDDPIARAFQLARSGKYLDIREIKQQLEREGYSSVSEHFSGATIKKQLRSLINSADDL